MSAVAQAEAIDHLLPLLTEEEMEIYKRGHNAKSMSASKNATLQEYHKATGLECLIGWLYLREEHGRIEELLQKAAEVCESG